MNRVVRLVEVTGDIAMAAPEDAAPDAASPVAAAPTPQRPTKSAGVPP